MITQFQLEQHELARRVYESELSGFFQKAIVMDPHVRVLHIQEGNVKDIHLGGKIELMGIWKKLQSLAFGKNDSVVLVNAGDFGLRWEFRQMACRDSVALDVVLEARFQIQDVAMFLRNWMQSQKSISHQQVQGRYYTELENCIDTEMKRLTREEISRSREAKDRLQAGVEKHLYTSFARDGILLVEITAMSFCNQKLEKMEMERRENHLMTQQERQRREEEIARAQMTLEYDQKLGEITLAQETYNLDIYRRRSQIWQQMREEVQKDKQHKLLDGQQMENFLRNLDKERLLGEADYRKVVEEIAHSKEDKELARLHLLARLRLEHDQELKMMEIVNSGEKDGKRLEQRLAQERRMLEQELSIEKMRNEARRHEEKENFAHQKGIQAETILQKLELQKQEQAAKVSDARTRLETEKIEMEITKGWQEIKRYKEEEELERELKREREKQAIALEGEARRMRLRIEEQTALHGMNVEVEKLRMQGKETEQKYHLEEQKVLSQKEIAIAQQAQDAQVAKGKLEMMENRLSETRQDRDRENDRYDRMIMQNMNLSKDLMEKALDKMGQVAISYANPAPSPAMPSVPKSEAPKIETKTCPNCMSQNPLAAKFCFHCGIKM